MVYFFIPIWWLFVASAKDAAGLFNGSSGALWFDETFALLPNPRLVTYNDGIYLAGSRTRCSTQSSAVRAPTVLSVLAGYGFAKFRFRGRRLMLSVLLGSVMVPLTALVIPTFILFSNLHLTDTVWAVILPSLLNPFAVYLMQVYTAEAVPDELLDAARVDGAGKSRPSRGRAPAASPSSHYRLALSIVGVWNNFFLPLAMLANTKLFPITVGLGLWEGFGLRQQQRRGQPLGHHHHRRAGIGHPANIRCSWHCRVLARRALARRPQIGLSPRRFR